MRIRAIRIRHMLGIDVVCITFALVAAFTLRFEHVSWRLLEPHLPLLGLALAVRLPVYTLFGLYHCMWRYASVAEARRLLAAGVISTVLVFVGDNYVFPLLGLPRCSSRSVLVLDGLINLICLGGSRLLLRLASEGLVQRKGAKAAVVPAGQRRVLIVGASRAGATLAREMRSTPELGLVPVGFVDDDPVVTTMRIHDVPVLGPIEDIPALASREQIDEVILGLPAAPGSTVRRIRQLCREAGIGFRTIPSLYELLGGKVSVKQLREVRIEDLLRREQVDTDQTGVRAYVRGARVLVTGAGGSIGSEICRQLAQHEPELLVLMGHGENSIFNVERSLRAQFPTLRLESAIADTRDTERVRLLVGKYRPSAIFHAAAHKHVPLMQANAEEAFTNNVLGTQSVLRAAEACGVERFVMISTDKAVRPTSVMGATKRVAELLVQDAARRTGKRYVAVRFGNVLGSRGSAVPIFQEQIAAGGPVTVTHPEMRRYFMTIPEAVQLVLQAAALGHGGEVFMLDMGEPVRILDLATYLIELSGLSPKEDIAIQFTGLRPGEKLYEELALDSEHYRPTAHQKILVCHSNARLVATGEYLKRWVAAAARFARALDNEAVLGQLLDLVPEFQSGQRAPAPPPASS